MPKSDVTRATGESESSRTLTLTFSDQTAGQHLVGVVGIALWCSCYAGYLATVGSTSDTVWSSMTATVVHSRATAATIATLVCGCYFGVLVVKGVGGPVLNLLYAGTTVLILPRILHRLVGRVPEGYFTAVSPVSRFAFRGVAVDIVLPGMVAVLLIPIVWFALVCRDDAERHEWVRRNIPRVPPRRRPVGNSIGGTHSSTADLATPPSAPATALGKLPDTTTRAASRTPTTPTPSRSATTVVGNPPTTAPSATRQVSPKIPLNPPCHALPRTERSQRYPAVADPTKIPAPVGSWVTRKYPTSRPNVTAAPRRTARQSVLLGRSSPRWRPGTINQAVD